MSAPPFSQPAHVKLAVRLMYVGAALSLLYNVMRIVFRSQIAERLRQQLGDTPGAQQAVEQVQHSGFGLLVAGLLTAGLWLWMAAMVNRGRRWARVLSIILSVVGLLSGGLSLLTGGFWVTLALSLAITLISAVILYCLVQKSNADWFAQAT